MFRRTKDEPTQVMSVLPANSVGVCQLCEAMSTAKTKLLWRWHGLSPSLKAKFPLFLWKCGWGFQGQQGAVQGSCVHPLLCSLALSSTFRANLSPLRRLDARGWPGAMRGVYTRRSVLGC